MLSSRMVPRPQGLASRNDAVVVAVTVGLETPFLLAVQTSAHVARSSFSGRRPGKEANEATCSLDQGFCIVDVT